MNGKTDKEILETRERIIKELIENKFEVVDSYFSDYNIPNDITNKQIYLLSKAIAEMSKCDYIYFAKDWDKCRGCIVEHYIAEKYGLTILLEEGEIVERN